LFSRSAPPFLVLCAVTARKVWASIARVICRCQASRDSAKSQSVIEV
jgi:hypothetical protein